MPVQLILSSITRVCLIFHNNLMLLTSYVPVTDSFLPEKVFDLLTCSSDVGEKSG